MKVVKFGGTSLANAENILKAKSIVEADPIRSFVVVSAPGKGKDFSRKVTDLLIDAHAQLCFSDTCDSCDTVFGRFEKLSSDLGVDISAELERAREEIYINKCDYDFVVSRGEYLMAVLFAKLLDWRFLDAAQFIVIKESGLVDLEATKANFSKLPHGKYVMGGFYGRAADARFSSIARGSYGVDAQYGRVARGSYGAKATHKRSEYGAKTKRDSAQYRHEKGGVRVFARGGSDYSGAIAAVCLNASVYENFTDTHGVQSANPATVKNTATVTEIDYSTLYKLCRGGASVIYPNCIPLLRRAAMPLKVACTFDPAGKSTLVTSQKPLKPFFSITYETKQNINKDTVEILCVTHKIDFPLSMLRAVLKGIEVYLVEFSKCDFRLITPASNLVEVINLLHKAFTDSKSTLLV